MELEQVSGVFERIAISELCTLQRSISSKAFKVLLLNLPVALRLSIIQISHSSRSFASLILRVKSEIPSISEIGLIFNAVSMKVTWNAYILFLSTIWFTSVFFARWNFVNTALSSKLRYFWLPWSVGQLEFLLKENANVLVATDRGRSSRGWTSFLIV